jgi:Txe/YoeB family toxin of Txe-Axe toxin-antitoxin module
MARTTGIFIESVKSKLLGIVKSILKTPYEGLGNPEELKI